MSFATWYSNNIMLFYTLLIYIITLLVIGVVVLIQDPDADPYLPVSFRNTTVSILCFMITCKFACLPPPPANPLFLLITLSLLFSLSY